MHLKCSRVAFLPWAKSSINGNTLPWQSTFNWRLSTRCFTKVKGSIILLILHLKRKWGTEAHVVSDSPQSHYEPMGEPGPAIWSLESQFSPLDTILLNSWYPPLLVLKGPLQNPLKSTWNLSIDFNGLYSSHLQFLLLCFLSLQLTWISPPYSSLQILVVSCIPSPLFSLNSSTLTFEWSAHPSFCWS